MDRFLNGDPDCATSFGNCFDFDNSILQMEARLFFFGDRFMHKLSCNLFLYFQTFIDRSNFWKLKFFNRFDLEGINIIQRIQVNFS